MKLLTSKKILCIFGILVSFSLGFHSHTYAGGWSSGGGSGIICFSTKSTAALVREKSGLVTDEMLQEIESIEALDIYEAKNLLAKQDFFFNARLAEPKSNETPDAFVLRALKRFRDNIGFNRTDNRSDIGQRLLNTYLDLKTKTGKVHWVPQDSSLIHLKDEGLILEQKPETSAKFDNGNCALVPLAVQETTNNQVRILIDSRLYEHPKHKAQSKAALTLHELVYYDARLQGQADSRKARLLVGILLENAKDAYHTSVIERVCQLGFLDMDVAQCSRDGAKLDFLVRIRAVAEAVNIVTHVLQASVCNNFSEDFHFNSMTEVNLVQIAKLELKKFKQIKAADLNSIKNTNQAFFFLSKIQNSNQLTKQLDEFIRKRNKLIQSEVYERSKNYLSSIYPTLITNEQALLIQNLIQSVIDNDIAEVLDKRQHAQVALQTKDVTINDPEHLKLCDDKNKKNQLTIIQLQDWVESHLRARVLPLNWKFLYPIL